MKRALALILAAVMALALVACGQKETPTTPDNSDQQQEDQTPEGWVPTNVLLHGHGDPPKTLSS